MVWHLCYAVLPFQMEWQIRVCATLTLDIKCCVQTEKLNGFKIRAWDFASIVLEIGTKTSSLTNDSRQCLYTVFHYDTSLKARRLADRLGGFLGMRAVHVGNVSWYGLTTFWPSELSSVSRLMKSLHTCARKRLCCYDRLSSSLLTCSYSWWPNQRITNQKVSICVSKTRGNVVSFSR